MSEQPAPADHARQQLEPAAADAVRASRPGPRGLPEQWGLRSARLATSPPTAARGWQVVKTTDVP